MSNKNRSILTLIVLVIGIIVANYLGFRANTDTGDIANNTFNDTNYFFPATYVFTTIWPVIYTGLLGWAIYQALPANRDNPRFRAAAEDRPRDDPVALLQAVTAGAQLIMEESQIDCRVRIHHKILTQGHQGARRNPHSPKFGAALARRDDAPG